MAELTDIEDAVPAAAETLMLDPFGFVPGRASRIAGLGGAEPSPDPAYVFHTPYADCGTGTVCFTVRFAGLEAGRGTIHLRIHAVAEEIKDGVKLVASRAMSLRELASTGGEVTLGVEAEPDTVYAIMGFIYDRKVLGLALNGTDARATGLTVEVSGRGDQSRFVDRLAEARRTFLDVQPRADLRQFFTEGQATLTDPVSQMCTMAQFDEPVVGEWLHRMHATPMRHRKQWELVFIAQALRYYGALVPGARGLGFGCGVELLPATFAALGCTIVATDLPSEDERAAGWNSTQQHGASIEAMRYPAICPDAVFDANVSFRPVDMTDIPADLAGFDFTWSSCAYEHLGSIEAGLKFFEDSVRCLRPGGIAIHTTELNLASNDRTIADGPTVLFRRRDFEELALRLEASGHTVIPIKFDTGDGPLDTHIDLPPYKVDDHVKVALSRYVTTSFGMIARAGGG